MQESEVYLCGNNMRTKNKEDNKQLIMIKQTLVAIDSTLRLNKHF